MNDPRLSELTERDFEIARKAVEDCLIEFRDARLSLLGRNNGLVVKERDGKESSVIRLGFEMAMKSGVDAILKARQEST